MVCAGCFDGQIVVYELTERFLLPNADERPRTRPSFGASFVLAQHEGPVTALSLLYDELYLLSAAVDLTIKLWCLRSRQPLMVYKGHLQKLWCMSWAPAGYWFATGSGDNTAMLWATDHIHCQRVFDHGAAVVVLAFPPSVQ